MTTASAVDLAGEITVFPRTLKGLTVAQEENGRDRIGGKGRRRERNEGRRTEEKDAKEE